MSPKKALKPSVVQPPGRLDSILIQLLESPTGSTHFEADFQTSSLVIGIDDCRPDLSAHPCASQDGCDIRGEPPAEDSWPKPIDQDGAGRGKQWHQSYRRRRISRWADRNPPDGRRWDTEMRARGRFSSGGGGAYYSIRISKTGWFQLYLAAPHLVCARFNL